MAIQQGKYTFLKYNKRNIPLSHMNIVQWTGIIEKFKREEKKWYFKTWPHNFFSVQVYPNDEKEDYKFEDDFGLIFLKD